MPARFGAPGHTIAVAERHTRADLRHARATPLASISGRGFLLATFLWEASEPILWRGKHRHGPKYTYGA